MYTCIHVYMYVCMATFYSSSCWSLRQCLYHVCIQVHDQLGVFVGFVVFGHSLKASHRAPGFGSCAESSGWLAEGHNFTSVCMLLSAAGSDAKSPAAPNYARSPLRGRSAAIFARSALPMDPRASDYQDALSRSIDRRQANKNPALKSKIMPTSPGGFT